MFGTVLEKLSTLLSKSFIIASFFPIVIFAAANGLMLYSTSASFRAFAKHQYDPSLGAKAALMVFVLCFLAIVAYVFSPLNLTLRELLEGRHWPKRLSQWGQGRHIRRMDSIQRRFTESKSNLRDLDRFNQMGGRLIESRNRGSGKSDFVPAANAARSVENLLAKRADARDISSQELEEASKELELALESGDADIVDPNSPYFSASERLDRSQQDFFRVWKYLDNRVQAESIDLYNQLQFNYAQDEVAPTAMGNTGLAARYYSESRYGLNLDVLWSRMQKVLQQDEKFYAMLQDAKTQLDFLVSMFWLTAIFCMTWTVTLLVVTRGYVQFLLIVVVGPWIAAGFYGLALQNQRAFADLLRGSVDMFRMQLLNQLHIPLPAKAEDERALWTLLGNRMGYDNHEKNLTFVHPPKTP